MILEATDFTVKSLAFIELSRIKCCLQLLQFITGYGKFSVTDLESVVLGRVVASGDSHSSLHRQVNCSAIEHACGRDS